jgi:flagellar biosynthetic protein FlhB
VPKADVIITNPTHFAVALQYDGATMEAPKVIAKGQDYVALKIKEIAREHGIVTMENKPLARALYERTEIGDLIPADLFQAVAEVLAYVYQLKGRTK